MSEISAQPVLTESGRPSGAAALDRLAQRLRLDVFDVLHDKGTGHWGGASSCAEILTALYFDFLRIDPERPGWPLRDRLVVSKGHASCMLYAVLAERGFFPREELRTFRQLGSRLQGHPCMTSTPGVDMSTGSLGHGLSVALGMALSARLAGHDYWSFALLGEGCLNEGQTWEAVMAAAKLRPPRLVALIDNNGVQLDGPAATVMPIEPLADKFRAFGWNVAPTAWNGNSCADVLESFDWLRAQTEWPAAIVYKTNKGRGVSFMEDNAYWHGAPIDDDSYARGRAELERRLAELEEAL